ncbi:C-type lectin 37Db-like isoform X2 [Penaeus monodon]|uniref:C-type lectin 37Db-like isoform X2 n=1 Tax=Penaeus monodon TaxID=6687 RepID=UPI0018A7776D|nr:C-type lectin 37Db-like isoform X2 [Penaeus monodon]
MRKSIEFLTLLLALVTQLDGQGLGKELRSPTANELIAQLLLRRAQSSANKRPGRVPPGPVFSQPKRATSSDSSQSEIVDLENLLDTGACSGSGCGDGEDFASRWTMPLMRLGDKRYYLGIFFKANWYKASQYCRFHGMHLASIESARENGRLESYIQEVGLGHEHFWTSGTDQGEEGRFFWMSNGRPITFDNWNAGEPNNFQYENGEMEHCLELWNRDGKGLKWNDSPCSFETFFICEVA